MRVQRPTERSERARDREVKREGLFVARALS